MTFTRAEALSFLNRLVSDSTPLMGFIVGHWGMLVFIGSIQHLTSEYMIIAQPIGGGAVLPIVVAL